MELMKDPKVNVIKGSTLTEIKVGSEVFEATLEAADLTVEQIDNSSSAELTAGYTSAVTLAGKMAVVDDHTISIESTVMRHDITVFAPSSDDELSRGCASVTSTRKTTGDTLVSNTPQLEG